LPMIDVHFWDWILWLGSKRLRGQTDLVREELDKMWNALLQPIGAPRRVVDVAEATNAYVVARRVQERKLRVQLDHRLERQVTAALAQSGVIATDHAPEHDA